MSVRSVLTIAGTIGGAVVGSAFGPVGTAIGASVGGSIGGYVGSIVDPITIEGPRLEDLSVISSAYGVPIPWIFGADNRLAGNVIWSSGLIERKKKKKAGGKGGGGDTVTEYSYSVDVAVAVGTGPCRGMRRIWCNGKLLWDVSDPASTAPMLAYNSMPWTATAGSGLPKMGLSKLAFYPGNETQLPDPTIEAAEGIGNVPGYRGTCYVVLTGLQLGDYGNSTPNIEFEIDGLAPRDCASIAASVFSAAGLASGDYGIEASVGQPVAGYILSAPSTALAALFPLASVYFWDVVENGGQIRLLSRSRAPVATIQLGDVGARARTDDAEADEGFTLSRGSNSTLPHAATITYTSKPRDYQESSQTAGRSFGDAQNILESRVAITLSDAEARRIADTMLFEPWVARMTLTVSVSARFEFLKPGDVIAFPVADGYATFRIDRAPRGVDGSLQLALTAVDPTVYSSVALSESPVVPPNVPSLVLDTLAYPFNSPILGVADSPTAFSWATGYPSADTRGAAFFRSIDGGVSYSQVGDLASVPNVVATVSAALPAGPTDVFDMSNTLTITMLSDGDELESFDETAIANGANACWLGAADGSHGEVLQFTTATLLDSAPRVYELSGLLRGRRATEHEVGLHDASDIFVQLESEFLRTADFSPNDLDRERLYKAVTTLQSLDDATAVPFTNTGERAECRSPVLAAGVRDASNNLTITWVRRIRGYAPGLGYGVVPLDEPVEAYEVDVYLGAAVVRTIATSIPSALYNAADQTADGITPGANVDVRIYQISATRGRGHAGIFKV